MLTTADFEMKRGDTPTVRWEARDRGKLIDLADTVATMFYRRGTEGDNQALLSVDPATNSMSYTFDGTLSPGTYAYEIRLVRDGVELTVPTRGTGRFIIRATIHDIPA
jgi:hypothetical protein